MRKVEVERGSFLKLGVLYVGGGDVDYYAILGALETLGMAR
jgi:hypothetical protein